MRPAAGSIRRRLSTIALMACAPIAPVVASGLGTLVSVVLGLFAAVLAINVVWVAVASERSHRREDASTIKDVRAIANQCVRIFGVLEGSIMGRDDNAYRAIDELATRTRLLVTQYRRYLEPAMLEALRYVESEMLDAQLRRKEPASLVLTIGKAVLGLKTGIRNEDDPELAAMRRRI